MKKRIVMSALGLMLMLSGHAQNLSSSGSDDVVFNAGKMYANALILVCKTLDGLSGISARKYLGEFLVVLHRNIAFIGLRGFAFDFRRVRRAGGLVLCIVSFPFE